MLNEKLDEARRNRAAFQRKIIVIFLGVVAVCGLLVFGMSLSLNNSMPSEAPVSPPVVLEEGDQEAARTAFKEMLKSYEEDVEPTLQGCNLEAWNKDGLLEINELKKRAIADFSATDYVPALKNLKDAVEKSKKIIADRNKIFDEALSQALSFLQSDDFDQAKLHITKALTVNPTAQDALDAQAKIDVLPQVLDLLAEARIAQSENNMQKEYDILQAALQIALDRTDISNRLKILSESLKDVAFQNHIAKCLALIERRRASGARKHFSAAKNIYPDRQELSVLSAELLELEKELRIEQALRNAEKAKKLDDWNKALEYFMQAGKDAPNNKEVLQGQQFAQGIISLKQTVAQHLANPYRLSNTTVRNSAKAAISQSIPVLSQSPSLTNQVRELADMLEKLNKEISVTVTSDNQTNVLVRGVGKVGIISEKVIHLKPGAYVFEGLRKGYKAKLIKVEIPFGKSNFHIEVICDETI